MECPLLLDAYLVRMTRTTIGVKRVIVPRATEEHGGMHLKIITRFLIPVEAASTKLFVIIIEEDPISATKYVPFQTRMEITMEVMDKIFFGIILKTIVTIHSSK